MNIHIRKDKKIEIEMKKHIEGAISWFGENITDRPVNPANTNLFNVEPSTIDLEDDISDTFHSIVAKLLFVCKRARPNIEPAIAYLCTRVSKSSTDDWKKLRRVLAFLKWTIDDVRIIGAQTLQDFYTWVDAAYGVHDDMKSHTGGAMSLGTGEIHTRSAKQKLNTKSSTEAEVVVTSDYVPYNTWLRNFLGDG